MSTYYDIELRQLLAYVKEYKLTQNPERRATLEKLIKKEIINFDRQYGIDVEQLSEQQVDVTLRNIIHELNPIENQSKQSHPQHRLLEQHDLLHVHVAMIEHAAMPAMRMSKKLNELMRQLQQDPERALQRRDVPDNIKRLATKIVFLCEFITKRPVPRDLTEKDLYATGAEIANLLTTNQDNYIGKPKLGAGLGGPLGTGVAGQLREDIDDLLKQMLVRAMQQQNQPVKGAPSPLPMAPSPYVKS